MATIDELRAAVADHAELTEAPRNTSFRVATFKVRGKAIIAVEKDRVHATFALTETATRRLVEASDIEAETITRAAAPIGVRVELARLTTAQLRRLVELSLERASVRASTRRGQDST